MHRRLVGVALAWALCSLSWAQDKGESTDAKKIAQKDLGKLLELIKPAGEHELAWREIPWMTDVDKARRKAAAEGKMIVWFSLTDHPLGMS